MFKIFKSLIYYEYDVPLSTISTIMSYKCTSLIFQRCTYRNSQIKINHLNVLHFSSPTCYMSSSRLACVDLGEGGSNAPPLPPKIQISFYMVTSLRRCRGPPLAVLNIQWTHSPRKHFLDRHMTCKPPLRIHVT